MGHAQCAKVPRSMYPPFYRRVGSLELLRYEEVLDLKDGMPPQCKHQRQRCRLPTRTENPEPIQTVRRSARLEARRNATIVQEPTATSQPEPPGEDLLQGSGSSGSSRLLRSVNTNDECPICKDSLGLAEGVARCNHCGNDYHRECALKWFMTATASPHCGFW